MAPVSDNATFDVAGVAAGAAELPAGAPEAVVECAPQAAATSTTGTATIRVRKRILHVCITFLTFPSPVCSPYLVAPTTTPRVRDHRKSGDVPDGFGMLRREEQLLGGPFLDEPAVEEQGRPVTDAGGLGQIVGHHDHGEPIRPAIG